MDESSLDWVAIYAAALSTVIGLVQGVRFLLNRRVRVECQQFTSELYRNGKTPHLKITVFNRGQQPFQIIDWGLEDTSLRGFAFAHSWLGQRMAAWPGFKRPLDVEDARVNFTTTAVGPGAERSLAAPKIPCVVSPQEPAEWYMELDGLRDELLNMVGANPDHVRARVTLGDRRSFVSKWFAIKEYRRPTDPDVRTVTVGPFIGK